MLYRRDSLSTCFIVASCSFTESTRRTNISAKLDTVLSSQSTSISGATTAIFPRDAARFAERRTAGPDEHVKGEGRIDCYLHDRQVQVGPSHILLCARGEKQGVSAPVGWRVALGESQARKHLDATAPPRLLRPCSTESGAKNWDWTSDVVKNTSVINVAYVRR